MTDYSELKKLAEACDASKCADESEYGRRLADFYDECEPDEILALIAENEQLKTAIGTPESVFINMKAHKIARPTLRSMVDLYGDVVNGDEAQLLEIAKLRAENELLKSDLREMTKFKDHMVELRETHGFDSWAAALVKVDKLKAENEALRKALTELLDLYDTDEGCRNLPQYIAGRAAMSKGEQP